MRRGTAMASASISRIAFFGLAASLSMVAARASAADAEPYRAEYRAYDAAMEAGDEETAARHGLAAWKAAEQALGDHRLTGILAYNYGRLIILTATEQALAPLRRASALQRAGVVELAPDTLRLYLSYAEFVASGFGEEPADDLREALNTVGLQDESLIHHVAPMWLKLTVEEFSAEEYRNAEVSAAKAEAAILKADPNASRELAKVILLGAVASLGQTRPDRYTFQAAKEQFDRARRLFPPQKDLESFDPLLAQVMAWHRASRRALRKEMGWAPPDSGPAPPLFQYQADGSLECDDFEWEEQPSPHYPPGAVLHRYYGVVVVGYRLGEDLRVHDARVLAEIPAGEQFGEFSLAALSEWRAKSLPSGGSECSYVKFWNFGVEYDFGPS
jgi:hypothetical protein